MCYKLLKMCSLYCFACKFKEFFRKFQILRENFYGNYSFFGIIGTVKQGLYPAGKS